MNISKLHDIDKKEFEEYEIKKYTLEEIFGVTIDNYLKIHNKTIDELINELRININILRSNLKEKLNDDNLDNLIELIKTKIDDKQAHLKRLEDYKKNKKI